MHPFTLGTTPNPLLEKYQSSFFEKLHNLWKIHISPEDIPTSDFLLDPDIHSRLLSSMRPETIEKSFLLESLHHEWREYQNHGFSFQRKREECIAGTDIFLTLDFKNPDAEKSTHPDHKKEGVSLTFGSLPPTTWHMLFTQSFDIVKKVSPDFMDEISRLITKIIPFDVSDGKHNSGSYSDAIGHLLMSYPIGMDYPELALLEAILHEYNHNKLNLILQTERLLLDDYRENFYSPYRPDARHLHGIYLGVHAIAGAYWVIWNAHAAGIITLPENWQEKAVLYVLKNGLSLQVLHTYAHMSPLGKEIFEEIEAVHEECLGFIKQAKVSRETIQKAKHALITHYQDVKRNYPNILS